MTGWRRIGCGLGACIWRRLRAVLVATLVVAGMVGLPAAAQELRFDSITVQGLERIETATVLSLAGIARGAVLTAGELNDAFQRIQGSGLFESVELLPQANTLLIRLREYPTINIVNFEGNRRFDDAALAQMVVSQSRHVYSPATAEADANTIARAYAEAGRYSATVTPRIIRRDGNRVDLAFEIAEGAVSEVERLSFVGNSAFSDRRLRQVLATKQAGIFRTLIRADTFVADRVEFDKQLLTDFYRSRGYIDFQVLSVATDFSRQREGFFLTFSVHEGQSYRIAGTDTVSELPEVDAAEFGREMRIDSGDVFSPSAIDNTISRMEALALNKGLSFVQVQPRITRNDRDLTVDVTFALVRGPRIFVERIDIEGNTTTLDQVIRRQFRTVEGDPFNPREIRNAAERIRALGFFASTDVNARPGTSADQVVVDVNVEEQPTGSLSFGASYGVATGLGASIQLQESNFLGRGQFVTLNISTAAESQKSQLTFIEPYLLGRDLKFSIDVNYNTTNKEFANYQTRLAAFSTGLEFPVSENGRLQLRYAVKRDELFDIVAGSSPMLTADLGARVSSGLGYTYTHDTRITGLSPNAAMKLNFTQDFLGLGGDVAAVRSRALLSAQTRIWQEEVALRAELEGGALHMLSGNSRVLDRFAAGTAVRGFEPNGYGPRDIGAGANNDALGGNYFAALRLEAEFPVGLPEEYGITGGVFWDIGSVWGLNDTTAASDMGGSDTLHWRSTIGVSVFWDTAIGPFRFNFSRALAKESYDIEQSFDVTISARF